MPTSPSEVTSAPALAWQPWNATGDNPTGKWQTVDGNSGPANMSGNATGDFESGDGWSQT